MAPSRREFLKMAVADFRTFVSIPAFRASGEQTGTDEVVERRFSIMGNGLSAKFGERPLISTNYRMNDSCRFRKAERALS